MNCKQCGNEISPEAKFCGVCGAPNEASQPVQEAVEPVQEAVQTAEPQYAQPVEPAYPQPEQPAAEPQYAQPVQQPQYAQPVQHAQYAQPVQQPQYAQPVQQPQYAQPVQQPMYNQQPYTQPQYAQTPYGAPVVEDPVERSISKSVLIFGILAISFAFIPYINFLGIIFGAIALSKAKKYVASGYVLAGRAKTGRILGLIGLIAGIVCTVFWTIIIIIAIIGVASYTSSYYYYY